MDNSWSILTLIAGNILLTTYIPRLLSRWNIGNHITILFTISALALPPLCTTIIYYDIPHFSPIAEDSNDFLTTLLAAELVNIFVVTLAILVRLSTSTRNELREERELKHRSEYQYERLKQQINPHFLFNSLGILDYLVQEHETERASSFIRKLANIYRYMLKNDNKPLVKLSEEMDFTRMYIDLLKERFTEGMVVEIEIERELHDRYVVPCAVQLLVENATKHNIVSAEQPLTINITTEEGMLVVRNRLQLRTHGQPSTRLGLENIRRQYQDITRRDISVEKTDSEFIVKLPIV
jgi:LytS/YehU family sensor histidine kinase